MIVSVVRLFIIYLICLPNQSFTNACIIHFALLSFIFKSTFGHCKRLNGSKLNQSTKAGFVFKDDFFVGVEEKETYPIFVFGTAEVQEVLWAQTDESLNGDFWVCCWTIVVLEITFADQYCIGASQDQFLAESTIQESNFSVEGSSSDHGFGVLSQA